MTDLIPAAGDVVRVHQGVMSDGRHLGGMHLTVTRVYVEVEVDTVEWTGDRPIHLPVSAVDVVHRGSGWW